MDSDLIQTNSFWYTLYDTWRQAFLLVFVFWERVSLCSLVRELVVLLPQPISTGITGMNHHTQLLKGKLLYKTIRLFLKNWAIRQWTYIGALFNFSLMKNFLIQGA
jgi:hypothetical protein